jgi:PhoD-like phosphatase
MPDLVLGPILRYVGETEAVVWVETDAACEVDVLGSRARTFHVDGHHYAIVHVRDLEPGTWHEYEVELDGDRAWPLPASQYPPSAFRTYPKGGPLTIVFGSCRVSAPHEPPYTLKVDEHPLAREIDALHALAVRMLGQERDDWPDLLLLLGDQVYADENVSPGTKAFIESRRDVNEPPGPIVVDFDEYTRLYHESWSEPGLRWLLSTVSTAMIFDDHDVHDDWNTSAAWLEEMRRQDWWHDHAIGALTSYWVYQHLGNLAPSEHESEEVLGEVQQADDAGPVLRDFARRFERNPDSYRWSYCRDVGSTRLVVIDSRAGRVLTEGERSMVDEHEWDWIVEHAAGGFDHLLIGSSLPFLLSPGMHHLEAWNEAVCAGAWGERAARVGEKLRQGLDLEHWAAFDESFRRLAELIRSVGAGERGGAPASIVNLGGDVHHAYLAEVAFPPGSGVRSGVWQAVCSPVRHPLGSKERLAVRLALSRPFEVLSRALARSAGVDDLPLRWRSVGEAPVFDNVVASLSVDGPRLDFRLEKALPPARLEPVIEARLA